MPTKRMQPTSAKQLAIELLGAASEPLRAKELAKRIIESGRCSGLKGKTPEATISAMLAVGAKPGGPFKHVDKGAYTLADRKQPNAKTRAGRVTSSKASGRPAAKAKRSSRARAAR